MSNIVDLLPALLVVAPILLATVPIVLGLRYDRTGWSVAAVTTTALFGASLYLASVVYGRVLAGTEETARELAVIHELGGFQPPVGIELVADPLSTLIVLLVTATAMGVLAFTRMGGPRGSTFYSGYLLLTGGLLGLSMTGDVFNMFVFLEIVGLGSYALISSGDGPESAVAALKYLILSTLGASIYLIGVGFLFMATGTLNMADLATTIPTLEGGDLTLARAAFAFIFVGFAIKVAQWPLHTWQPDAYQYAPDGVTPLIAALVSTVSAYALGRVMFTVYGGEFLTATPYLSEVVVAVGATSVIAGSTLAVIQTDVKRMLAYSSVSQFGLVIAAYGLLNELALLGAIVHLVGHGLMKAGLFIGVGIVALGYGARTVNEYADLGKRRPFTAGGMAILLIALVGIPPSIGFVGKWYIAVGAIEAQAWPVAAVIFLSTMLTLAYVARLLEKMYFTPAKSHSVGHAPTAEGVATDGGAEATTATGSDLAGTVTIGMLAVLVVTALVAVILGFAGGLFAELLEPFIESAALEVSS